MIKPKKLSPRIKLKDPTLDRQAIRADIKYFLI